VGWNELRSCGFSDGFLDRPSHEFVSESRENGKWPFVPNVKVRSETLTINVIILAVISHVRWFLAKALSN